MALVPGDRKGQLLSSHVSSKVGVLIMTMGWNNNHMLLCCRRGDSEGQPLSSLTFIESMQFMVQ